MRPKILWSAPLAPLPNYVEALALAGGELTREEDSCHGLLLPGGGDLDPALYGQEEQNCRDVDRERDEQELALCRRFLEAGKPVVGICRGAQVLAVALGGTLIQHVEDHGILPNSADRLHDTHTAGILTGLYGPVCTVNSAHHQAVDRLPEGCRILQLSTDGVIEAFSVDRAPVLAVQWHPERLCGRFARPDAVDGLPLLRYFLSLCRDEP